jgi:hypothetical protein
MREKFAPLIKSSATQTDPAAETKSIGLQADARVVMVFASPSRQFYHDVTNPAHLSGPCYPDNFILTRNLNPSIGTMQKRMPTLTRTATNQTAGPLVVTITDSSVTSNLDKFVIRDNFLIAKLSKRFKQIINYK